MSSTRVLWMAQINPPLQGDGAMPFNDSSAHLPMTRRIGVCAPAVANTSCSAFARCARNSLCSLSFSHLF